MGFTAGGSQIQVLPPALGSPEAAAVWSASASGSASNSWGASAPDPADYADVSAGEPALEGGKRDLLRNCLALECPRLLRLFHALGDLHDHDQGEKEGGGGAGDGDVSGPGNKVKRAAGERRSSSAHDSLSEAARRARAEVGEEDADQQVVGLAMGGSASPSPTADTMMIGGVHAHRTAGGAVGAPSTPPPRLAVSTAVDAAVPAFASPAASTPAGMMVALLQSPEAGGAGAGSGRQGGASSLLPPSNSTTATAPSGVPS